MDHSISRESDFEVDLESCRSVSGEAGNSNSTLDTKAGNALFNSVCNGDGEELSKAENGLNMNRNIKDDDELTRGSGRVSMDEASLVESKKSKEKRKSMSAKKPPKPPRPPRGLSLDAADQKLIKEIKDLAMVKRARIERMKALKKMKVAKASTTSSALNGSSLALLFTVFFFFVLLFQGISYRSSTMNFYDSVQSGRVRENGFISVQEGSNLSTSTAIVVDSGSGSSDKVEQASGLIHGNSSRSITS